MAASGVTILIADDDPGHVELVRRNLRRAGVANHIDSVSTGTQALDYVLGRGEYAEQTATAASLLVLLDVNMPGNIDGVEVLRQLKSDEATRHVPIVMLTTADDPREINRCYGLGCNVYVTKPIDPSAFVAAIHRLGDLLSLMSMPTEDLRRA